MGIFEIESLFGDSKPKGKSQLSAARSQLRSVVLSIFVASAHTLNTTLPKGRPQDAEFL
jgi:hypothetical protein